MQDLSIGEVVVSVAGRDMGSLYFVKEIKDNYLMLVNGKGKTNQNPKLKKIKHIKPIGFVCESLKEKWLSNEKVLDAEIRKQIKLYFL